MNKSFSHPIYAIKAIALSLALLGVLTACQPKADSSDPEALVESVQAMVRERPEDDKERLARALHILALTETGYLGDVSSNPVEIASDATLGPALLRVLDGDTFDDIIKKATKVKSAELQEAIQSAQRAQQDVRARIAQAEAEISQLRDYEIKRSVYGWSRGDYLPQAYVEFTLVNRGEDPVTGVKMRSTLKTSEKDEPWVYEVLAHEMVRSHPARASADYRLVPNQFSAWGNRQLQQRRDTRLSMEIINVRVGNEWLVSADPLVLQKELNHYLKAEQEARSALGVIQANGRI